MADGIETMEFDYWVKWKWTGNGIGDEGAIKISEALMTNTAMTKLLLSGDDKMNWNWKVNDKIIINKLNREWYWCWRSKEIERNVNGK